MLPRRIIRDVRALGVMAVDPRPPGSEEIIGGRWLREPRATARLHWVLLVAHASAFIWTMWFAYNLSR